MTTAFKTGMEAGDLSRVAAALAEDVVFHSPVTHTPTSGRDAVLVILQAVLDTFQDFRYTEGVESERRSVLFFSARVGNLELEGIDALRLDADGRVSELTVMIRPLSALTLVKDHIVRRVAASQAQQQ
jgi:hypothetical protein